MKYICPHCKAEIEYLDYAANYSEMCFGRSHGIVYIESEDTEFSDCDQTDTDNFEEDEFDYFCPKCEHDVDLYELRENSKIDEMPNKNILNTILNN